MGNSGRTGAARLSEIITASTKMEALKVNPNSTGNLINKVKVSWHIVHSVAAVQIGAVQGKK